MSPYEHAKAVAMLLLVMAAMYYFAAVFLGR